MKRVPLWVYGLAVLNWSTFPGFRLDVLRVCISIVVLGVILALKLRKRSYIGGSLTGLSPMMAQGVKLCYERFGLTCDVAGFPSYIPHLHTDPIRHPNVSPATVFWLDFWKIFTSNFILMCMDHESFGVGVELVLAWIAGTRVVLVYRKGKKVSRMALGCPSVYHHIEYCNSDDVHDRLAAWLGIYQKNFWKQVLHSVSSAHPLFPTTEIAK